MSDTDSKKSADLVARTGLQSWNPAPVVTENSCESGRPAGLVKTKSSGPIASDDRRRRSKAAKISGAYEKSPSRASLGLRLEPAEARHAATLQSYRLAAK